LPDGVLNIALTLALSLRERGLGYPAFIVNFRVVVIIMF